MNEFVKETVYISRIGREKTIASIYIAVCNIPGYPSLGPRGCQITTAQCTPTHHPSRPFILGGLLPVGIKPPT